MSSQTGRYWVLGLLIFAGVASRGAAQSSLDSLENLNPIHDFEQIRGIIKRAFSEQNDPVLQRITALQGHLSNLNSASDSAAIIQTKLELAELYLSKQQYDDAIQMYTAVVRDYERMDDRVKIARISLELGTLYRYSDLPMPPREFYEDLKKTFIEFKDNDGLSLTLYNLGILETDSTRMTLLFNEALTIQEALLEAQPDNRRYLEHYSRYLNAAGRVEEALAISKRINADLYSVFYLNNLGDSERRKGNYAKALNYFNQSLALSKENRLKGMLKNTYDNMARIYWLKGDFETAFLYQTLASYLSADIWDTFSKNQLVAFRSKFGTVELETKNRLVNKDLEINQLILKQKKQENVILLFVVFVVSFLLLIIYINRLRIKESLALIAQQRDELVTKETRLKEAQKIAKTGDFEIEISSSMVAYSDECIHILELTESERQQDIATVLTSRIKEVDADFLDSLRSTSNETKDVLEREFQMSTVRGDSKWLRFVLQRRADESGTLFISGTVQDSTKAKQLQAVQLENVKNLKFTEELIVSQELERKRISAELHDGIGQELLLITNYAEMATDLVPKRNAKIADYLERISGNSNKLVGIIREIIYGLHPIYLDKLGLTETLVHTISTLCETNKITLETDIDEIDHELSKSDEVHLYRIIQELCSNAVKYSNAKVIRFSTENTPESLKVTFTDFGVGFDYQNKIDDNRPHFGLENIKHRCSLINAELHFASVLGEKTTCEIQILKNSLA